MHVVRSFKNHGHVTRWNLSATAIKSALQPRHQWPAPASTLEKILLRPPRPLPLAKHNFACVSLSCRTRFLKHLATPKDKLLQPHLLQRC